MCPAKSLSLDAGKGVDAPSSIKRGGPGCDASPTQTATRPPGHTTTSTKTVVETTA